MRNKSLIDGYRGISKETDKLISQFNKKIQQIKKEEIEVDNLQAKYNQLASGGKAPASLTSMETQLKKNSKEADNLKEKYDQIVSEINLKQVDFKTAESMGDVAGQNKIDTDLLNLDSQAEEVRSKIKSITNESEVLKGKIEELKMNPQLSMEAQNLQSKIALLKDSIKNSKTEASGMANEIQKAGKIDLSGLKDGLNSFKTSMVKGISGKNGISGGIDNISKKIDKFKSRVTRLVGTVMIFRLLRQTLTSLSNGFMSLLKGNDEFSSSLNQIKANLMTAFAPIYQYVLPAINSLMNSLSKVTGSIATFMASAFGQTASQAKKNAKELYNQANAQKAVSDAQEGTIASFDKLEVNEDKSQSNSSSSNSLDFSKDIQTSNYLNQLLDKLKNKIGNGLWFDAGATIADELNGLVKKIDLKSFFKKGKEIVTNLCNGINGFMGTFNWSKLGTKISDILRGLGSLVITALQTIDWQNIGNAIGDFLLSIDWIGIVSDIINAILAACTALVDLIIGLVDSIISFITNPESIEKFFQAGVDLVTGLIEGLGSLVESVGAFFLKLYELINDLIGIDEMVAFGADIVNGLVEGIINLPSKIGEIFSKALDFVKGIWSDVAGWFNSTIITPIGNFFDTIWNSITNGAKNAWSGIKNIFSTVATFFKNTFSNAWQKVKDVFSIGGKIFDGIKDGIVEEFRNIVNAIIKGINKVVKIPFDGINSALKKIKKVNIMGIEPFSWMPTISVPQIPLLAKGAVIPPNSEFVAILGDQKNGKNLEAPESLLRKIVKEESGGKEVVFNGTFILQCDVEKIGAASIKGIRLIEDKTNETYFVNS